MGRCSCNCLKTLSSIPQNSKQLLRTQQLPRHNWGCRHPAPSSTTDFLQRWLTGHRPGTRPRHLGLHPAKGQTALLCPHARVTRGKHGGSRGGCKDTTSPLQGPCKLLHSFSFSPFANLFTLSSWKKTEKENKTRLSSWGGGGGTGTLEPKELSLTRYSPECLLLPNLEDRACLQPLCACLRQSR